MTDSRDKKDPLGETCKKHLIQCYVDMRYHRRKDIRNKYITKGLAVEEKGITLYSRVMKQFYKKNDQMFENEYIIGTPDIVHNVMDIKSSWDIWTFYNVLATAPNKDYWWQLQGYMDLCDDDISQLIYVLISTPEDLIQQELRWLARDMAVDVFNPTPLYIEACEAVRHEMTFEDIPIERRYHEHTFRRDKEKMAECYEKLKLCREFLNKLP